MQIVGLLDYRRHMCRKLAGNMKIYCIKTHIISLTYIVVEKPKKIKTHK